jgi:Secretion system C-terminal sorting domain
MAPVFEYTGSGKNIFMKKYFIFLLAVIFFSTSQSQILITANTTWKNTGDVVIVTRDGDWINNGSFVAGSSLVQMRGLSGSIGGSSITGFHELEVARNNGQQLLLQSDAGIDGRIIFTTGNIDLSGHTINLATPAYLDNENEDSHILGAAGGEVVATINLTAPSNANPGNLGLLLSSPADLGSVTIRRGHKIQIVNGVPSSIARYYDISPTNNMNLDATLRFTYFNSELNNQAENTLTLYKSNDHGGNWSGQADNARNPALNFVEIKGLSDLSRWTLAASSPGTLPVTGLAFKARRISNTRVQLDWTTQQEFNNAGFYVERKGENESVYSSIGFVPSRAAGGNSGFPLSYSETDVNSFAGKMFYRLKQQDMDGHFIYSPVREVSGSQMTAIKVWPVPADGEFNILVSGIGHQAMLEIVDVSGKLVRQLTIEADTQKKIDRLPAGMYVLRVEGYPGLIQKIITR